MEKWRSKGKTIPKTDSLLPPTRRQPDVDTSSTEKRKGKRWTIGGFLKRISHREGDASSSGEASSINTPVLRRKKAKNILKNKSSRRAIRSSLQTNKDLNFEYKKTKPLELNPFIFPTVLPQESPYSRSSEGSLDGSNKKVRKDKIKARVEAKRDKLCSNSSTEESSNESRPQNGVKCDRRRRNMKTERLTKRLCKDDEEVQDFDQIIVPNERFTQDKLPDQIPPSAAFPKYQSQSPIDYQLKIHEAKNPLVRQTLQYFSDFDKGLNFNENHDREKRKIDSRRRQTQEIFPVTLNSCDVDDKKSKSQEDIYPHHFSHFQLSPRIQNSPHEYASSLDSYYRTPRIDYPARFHNPPIQNYQNQFDDSGIYSKIRSPSQRSDNSDFKSPSPSGSFGKEKYSRGGVENFPRGDRKFVKDRQSFGKNFNFMNDTHSNQDDKYSKKNPRNGVHLNDDKSTKDSDKYRKDLGKSRDSEKRSSKNLEDALCELEEIYNSLQLGDEDLLERAEKRSMEEYSNKKIENILSDLENSMNTSKRLEAEPNLLKDDMAFRRLRSANRPSSDGHSMLSNISYLITSPIVSQRDSLYVDPKQKTRGKEPDVTLDDVVFRNLHHANNTLKVVEPQPPFGIPLGPITGATESDYLHTKPSQSEPRSFYVSRNEPDIVTDDLAFRNLRKDKNIDKNSWERPNTFVAKKKRAVRSLSANLYSLINKKESPDEVEWDQESGNGTESVDARFGSEMEFDKSLDINGNQSDEVQLKVEEGVKEMEDRGMEVNRKMEGNERIGVNHQMEDNKRIDGNEKMEDNQGIGRNKKIDGNKGMEGVRLDEVVKPDEMKRNKSDGVELKGDDKVDLNSKEFVKEESEIGEDEPRNKDLGPFTEEEISVYRQLCQELENLVESTKGFEAQVDKSELDDLPEVPLKKVRDESDKSKEVVFEEKSDRNSTEMEIEEIGNEISSLREKLTNLSALDCAVCTKETDDTDEKKRGKASQIPDKVIESNLLKGVNERPHCSRKEFDSQDASLSEGADTTLT